MKKYIFILLWVTGSFASYFIGRACFRHDFHEWTVGDRAFVVGISAVGSWAAVGAFGIAHLLSGINSQQPAKW